MKENELFHLIFLCFINIIFFIFAVINIHPVDYAYEKS
jgi:uncharacterized integral membrane protein